jgi:uncharacterized membrane protein YgdD (TMEM256/DUF423 family)
MNTFWFATAAVLMLLGVAAEAFGAHALRAMVTPERLGVFQVATRNHLYHALGLFVVSFASAYLDPRLVDLAGWLLLAGIVIFAGSLYLLVLTDVRILGAITPIGGLAFLAGWATLVFAAIRK